MRPRASLLLALLALAPDVVAQDLWTRALTPRAAEARHQSARAVHMEFLSTLPARFLDLFAGGAVSAERDVLRRQALAAAERALALTPDDPRTLGVSGALRERLGDHAGALRDLDRALQLAPDHLRADLYFTRALVRTHLGDNPGTRDDYLAALRLPIPAHVRGTTLGNLADTRLLLGETAAAVEDYSACVQHAPDYALGWLGLAIALDRDGASPTEAAAQAVRVATQNAGGDEAILDELNREGVFFVPTFDRYTYEAMAHEALARMYLPGGERDADAPTARRHRVAARAAWEAWTSLAPADDRWRPRVARHLRALSDAAAPPR
jgi:tetratricopeptide (TPR) repeat protein